MVAKRFVAVVLALFVGSCSCLASLAAASSGDEHACCASESGDEASSDCCLRSPLPSGVALQIAPPDQPLGMVVGGQAPDVPLRAGARLDTAALSPPGAAAVSVPSSRAPPALPA